MVDDAEDRVNSSFRKSNKVVTGLKPAAIEAPGDGTLAYVDPGAQKRLEGDAREKRAYQSHDLFFTAEGDGELQARTGGFGQRRPRDPLPEEKACTLCKKLGRI